MSKNESKSNEAKAPEAVEEEKPMVRFWCESTVYPKGGMQFKSLDPFEGDPCRMNFPQVPYHGKPLSFLGEIWIDDPKVVIALMQDGGNVRYDAQQIVDSGILSFDQVCEVLGGDTPLVWVAGPAGIEKVHRRLVPMPGADVPRVDPELDVPIAQVARMNMEQVKDVAFAFGLSIAPRTGEKKAKQALFDHLKGLSEDEERAGMKKYKALLDKHRRAPAGKE